MNHLTTDSGNATLPLANGLDNSQGGSEGKQRQLGITGMAWITVACAALLAYAKSLGAQSMNLLFIYCGFVLATASLAAAFSGRLR